MLASRLSLRRCCFRELGYHVGCAVSGEGGPTTTTRQKSCSALPLSPCHPSELRAES